MDKNQFLYQLYLDQLAQQEQGNSLDKLKSYSSNINKWGNNLSTVGNTLKDNVNSEVAQKLGTSMSNLGSKLTSGTNVVSNTLEAPSNIYKGFANRTVGTGLQSLGKSLAGQSGALGTIGNVLSNTGATMTGAGIGAGTTAATTGTAVGSGAAAAGTGATAAGGAAAGTGAAAGGSAASGAAAAGPIGALVALGVMAATGANRKRAKKSGQALLEATNKMAEAGNQDSEQRLLETQQNTQLLQNMANQSLKNGVITGGAANIQNPDGSIEAFPTTKDAFSASLKNVGWDNNTINSALNGLNLGNKEMSDYINAYNETAENGQKILIPQTPEEITNARMLASGINPTQQGEIQTTQQIKQGVLNKLVNGIADFAAGYQENNNNGFSPENLLSNKFTITKEVPNTKLQDYQQNLINSGKYTPEQVQAVANKKNSGYKEINDWIKENPDAYNPTTTETTYRDKSKMGRLGEAVGTISRIAKNPAMQALVAGGISTALTGNPLYGAGMAYKFGNQRQMNNIYQQSLQEQGINVDPGIFGSITNTDFNTLMNPKYKQQELDLKKFYYDMWSDYRNRMAANAEEKTKLDKEYKTEKLKIDNKNADSRRISAGASATRANKVGSGKGKSSKPQDNPDWNEDLAGFTQIISNPKYVAKAGEAKARFIAKHGVDPMKYIKL